MSSVARVSSCTETHAVEASTALQAVDVKFTLQG